MPEWTRFTPFRRLIASLEVGTSIAKMNENSRHPFSKKATDAPYILPRNSSFAIAVPLAESA
jgi:hypothetical protein